MNGHTSAGYRLFHGDHGIAKDIPTAVQFLKNASHLGCDDAANKLAGIFYWGKGVIPNMQAAAQYSKLAAERGNHQAQHNYGVHLLEGLGVDQNTKDGNHWLEVARENGYKSGDEEDANDSNMEVGSEADIIKFPTQR
jgi:uncharacterized protein